MGTRLLILVAILAILLATLARGEAINVTICGVNKTIQLPQTQYNTTLFTYQVIGCDVLPLQVDVESSPPMERIAENGFGTNTNTTVYVTIKWVGTIWSTVLRPNTTNVVIVFEDGRIMLVRPGERVYPSCSNLKYLLGEAKAVTYVKADQQGTQTTATNITLRNVFRTEVYGSKVTIIPGPCIRVLSTRDVRLIAFNRERGCIENIGTEIEVCGSGESIIWLVDPGTGAVLLGPIRVFHTPPPPPIVPQFVLFAPLGLLIAAMIRRDLVEAVIGGAVFLAFFPLVAPVFGLDASYVMLIEALGWITLIVVARYLLQ